MKEKTLKEKITQKRNKKDRKKCKVKKEKKKERINVKKKLKEKTKAERKFLEENFFTKNVSKQDIVLLQYTNRNTNVQIP